MNGHPFDKFQIASYVAGDLSSDESKRLEKHLLECPDCQAYYESLTHEKEAFLSNHPFESIKISEPKKYLSFPNMRRYYALAATIVLLLVGSSVYYSLQRQNRDRIKGETGIGIVVQDLNGNIEKRDSHIYHPNERIQILYSCAGKNNFILVGIDDKGTLSIYFPQEGDSSIGLQKGADIPMPNSILLDDYIGRELFLAFFSDEKLYVPNVKKHILKEFNRVNSLHKLMQIRFRTADIHAVLIEKQSSEQ